jgi:hypothetical protein
MLAYDSCQGGQEFYSRRLMSPPVHETNHGLGEVLVHIDTPKEWGYIFWAQRRVLKLRIISLADPQGGFHGEKMARLIHVVFDPDIAHV